MTTSVLHDMIMERRGSVRPASFGAYKVLESSPDTLDGKGTIITMAGLGATVGGGYLCYQKWQGTGLIVYALLGAPFAFFAGAFVAGAILLPTRTTS